MHLNVAILYLPDILFWCSYFLYFLGDPKQDLAYERQYEQQTYQVIPEVIKNFIQYFHKTVSDLIDQKVYELQASRISSDVIDQKVYEIQDIYENRYDFIYFKKGREFSVWLVFIMVQ